MSRFSILVRFGIAEENMAAFLPLMLENAAASLRDEPGCERFDVLRPKGEADSILLYEIYTDKQAFDAHLASPHFARFDAATTHLVQEKQVTVLELLAET